MSDIDTPSLALPPDKTGASGQEDARLWLFVNKRDALRDSAIEYLPLDVSLPVRIAFYRAQVERHVEKARAAMLKAWGRGDRPECKVEGCDRAVHCRGMCAKHYRKMMWERYYRGRYPKSYRRARREPA